MGEGGARTSEAPWQWCGIEGRTLGLALQRLQQDAFDTAHVQQLHFERSLAGGIETGRV